MVSTGIFHGERGVRGGPSSAVSPCCGYGSVKRRPWRGWKETTRREAIVGGAKESAHQTVHAAGQTVRDPVGTVERAPESVGRLFSYVRRHKVEKRAQQLTAARALARLCSVRESQRRAGSWP